MTRIHLWHITRRNIMAKMLFFSIKVVQTYKCPGCKEKVCCRNVGIYSVQKKKKRDLLITDKRQGYYPFRVPMPPPPPLPQLTAVATTTGPERTRSTLIGFIKFSKIKILLRHQVASSQCPNMNYDMLHTHNHTYIHT